MCFKVRFSQLDGFRIFFFFTSSSITAVSIIFLCLCLLMLILVVTQMPLPLFRLSANLLSHLLFPTTIHPICCS